MENNNFKLVLKYLKKQKLWMFFLMLCMFTNIILQLISPQILSTFIDSSTVANAKLYTLWRIVFAYLGAVIAQIIFGVFTSYLGQRIGWQATNEFRRDIISHFISIDMEVHEKWTGGEMINRLDSDVQGLFSYFSVLVLKILSSSLLMIGILIVLYNENSIVSIAMLIFSLLSVWILNIVQNFGTKYWVRAGEETAKCDSFLKERIDNVIECHSNGAMGYFLNGFSVALKKLFKMRLPSCFMYPMLWSTTTMINACATVLALGSSIILWNQGLISLGMVYLIYKYSDLICDPIQEFRDNLGELQRARGSLMRVIEIQSIESKIAKGSKEIEQQSIKIEIDQLSFAYQSDEVLHNISFVIEAGDKLGIMGATASGKSTLAKLIARLYKYEKGDIFLNGISIKEITTKSLYQKLAYCTQNVQFVHGTIRDNITFYGEEYSDTMIMEAVHKLGLEQWLGKFANGLDSNLEMADHNLSAGEAQIISIIRIFIRDPAIVILDEITSKLDYATEKLLLEALDVLTHNRTVIAIAHKITALRWSKKIMILDQGNIIESGYKEDLLEDKNSEFYKLYSLLQD